MKKKILIVDDDPDIMEVISLILVRKGFLVKTSGDGEAIKAEMPDLLLLDFWMSGKLGNEICLEVKEDKLTNHIPVIIVSANPDIEEIARTCRADGFIAKPFKVKQLIDKVTSLIPTEKGFVSPS